MVGIAGVIGDVSAAGLATSAMPNLSLRLWLVSREAHIRKNEKGKYRVENLGTYCPLPHHFLSLVDPTPVGADKIDVGNYKPGAGFAISLFAANAAEFGETDLARDLLEWLEDEMHPIVPSPTGHGAKMYSDLSMIGGMNIFKARVLKKGDWEGMISSYPDPVALKAPKLDEVPFPDVMVARCHPEGDSGVSFVLRGPEQHKDVVISFKDLDVKKRYNLSAVVGGKRTVVVKDLRADEDGRANARISVGDRGEFELLVAQ
jgi:hypothetical protein